MKKIIILFCILLGLYIPRTIFAAEVYFSSPLKEFKVGDTVYFDIQIDPEGTSINAIEGDIIYPNDLLEYVDYYETDSLITGWVETPYNNGNSLKFAGIISGGFTGLVEPVTNTVLPGKIVRFVFMTKKEGKGSLSFVDTSVYENDGMGTKLESHSLPYEFSVSLDAQDLESFSQDINPPEPFTPLVKRTERLFDGKYFLVFSAKDKETGIAYYKVKEGFSRWVRAESPYLLNDQSLRSNIRVIAVDKNGNERLEKVVFNKYPFERVGLMVFIGLVIMLVFVGLFAYVYFKKRPKQ